jgi:hypothetical protein
MDLEKTDLEKTDLEKTDLKKLIEQHGAKKFQRMVISLSGPISHRVNNQGIIDWNINYLFDEDLYNNRQQDKLELSKEEFAIDALTNFIRIVLDEQADTAVGFIPLVDAQKYSPSVLLNGADLIIFNLSSKITTVQIEKIIRLDNQFFKYKEFDAFNILEGEFLLPKEFYAFIYHKKD